MKKIIIFLSLFVSTCALAAQVDPLWRLQRALIRPSLSISEIMGVDRALGIEEEALIEVFVKTSDTTLTAERIRNCGGKVRTITRTIITASLPAAVLEGEAAGWTEAEYIEAAKPMSPHNDEANKDTGVDVAQLGEAEEGRRVLGVPEHVARGLVDRHGPGPGGRVGHGPGVDLLGLESPALGHRHSLRQSAPGHDARFGAPWRTVTLRPQNPTPQVVFRADRR